MTVIVRKKYQIFVSSTYTDMLAERQAAVEAILAAGHIPAGMELFCAGDESQLEAIKRWIDDSDVYVLLLGGRYGTIESRTGRSYTEIEYDYAVSRGKPHFALLLSEAAIQAKVRGMGGGAALEISAPKKLAAFRKKITRKIVRFVEDAKDVRIHLPHAIADLRSRHSLVARGASPGYPNGYVKYENANGQGVNPSTGQTVPNTQSHYPMGP